MSRPAAFGSALLFLTFVVAAGAPWLSPNDPQQRFTQLLNAPPTRVRVTAADGLHIYRHALISRRARTFEEDRSRPTPLRWFSEGRVVTADPASGAPLLLLGADGYGRDIFARLLHGSRTTLLVALAATAGATLAGVLLGGIAGQSGGWVDAALLRLSEFILVLPAIYVTLSLRAVLPLTLPPAAVFALLIVILTLLGWPVVARGVRAIVLAERQKEYALAAVAAGCGRRRLLVRHLLPAASGYILTQATLLFPAAILAEATLSFVGLGFPDAVPTWGTMLQEAANVVTLGDAPWALSPAAAIFIVVLAVNLIVQRRDAPLSRLGTGSRRRERSA